MTEALKTKKVLVVDDDPTVLKLLEKVFASGGYEVVCSKDAPCGLEMALKGKPDLIILDIMMPIINGYNICRLLKSQEGQKHIPVILLTSRAGDEDRKIGVEVGADAYIPKPFKTEDLLSKARDLLNP